MKNYIATVSRRRGQPKTMQFQAPDIRDAAAHVRENYPLWGPDPHKGFKIVEAPDPEEAPCPQII